MLQYQSATFSDFSGGITDNEYKNPSNRLKVCNNLLLKENKSAFVRTGFRPVFQQDNLRRITSLTSFDGELFATRDDFVYKFDSGSLTQVDGISAAGNHFQNAGDNVYPSTEEWRNHLFFINEARDRPSVIYKDFTSGDYLLKETGIPQLYTSALRGNIATDPLTIYVYATDAGQDVAVTAIDAQARWGHTNNSYVYAIQGYHSYSVDSEGNENVVEERSYAINFVVFTQAPIDLTHRVEIRHQKIDRATTQLSNFDIRYYRTGLNQQDLYPLYNEVNVPKNDDAATHLFIDDNVNFTQTPTSGNEWAQGTFQPPKCKFMTIVDGTAWYAAVEDEDADSVFKPYEAVQSDIIPLGVDTAYRLEFETGITGVSNINGSAIFFTDAPRIYRIEGSHTADGRTPRKRVISEKIELASNKSIVKANQLLYFIGTSGVYTTDGYQIRKIPTSEDLQDTISEIMDNPTRRSRISGEYDNEQDIIVWSVSNGDTGNTYWFVLNLKTGGFTTCDSYTFESSSVVLHDKNLYRGDGNGYIYKHSSEWNTDIRTNTTLPITSWEVTEIPWEIETINVGAESPMLTKWFKSGGFTIETNLNTSILPQTESNFSGRKQSMKDIRFFGSWEWGDDNYIYGDVELVWGRERTKTFKRHFPKRGMRAKSKSLSIKPSNDTVLYKSGTMGQFIIEPNAGGWSDAFFQGGVALPSDVEGKTLRIRYIENENDAVDYVYYIDQRVSDSQLKLTGGFNGIITTEEWTIEGTYNPQELEIKSIEIIFAPISMLGNEYREGDDARET